MLSDVIDTNRRFSRSINVERDHGKNAIAGYLPTGRAVDVVGRVGRGMLDPAAGRAFSITGPHGGGKSSLAVFLDALLASRKSGDHRAAMHVLQDSDSEVAALISAGLKSVDPAGVGAIRAFATADRESITVTVARALYAAAVRDLGIKQRIVPKAFAESAAASELTPREILAVVERLTKSRPLILLVDEFGKNLEAYSSGGGDGDPYLLQELAESAQGENALPLVLVTMQHLSFDEYVQEASVTRRREWAKVQGRFQDIPYVETPAQSRRLITSVITRKSSPVDEEWERWLGENDATFRSLGLRDLAQAAPNAFPLHPLVLAVLPDLCSRYGQNERTLFSFLAGVEPLALPRFLETNSWTEGLPLPLVRLDRVYDYFLDSATTSVGTSATASRWLEIESRIRDTAGLTEAQSRALKSVGVLNLVSSAGTLRASRQLLHVALLGSCDELADSGAVDECLESLEALGLVTYREYADEFRIWNGSDFDLRGAVDIARRAARSRGLAELLNETVPLDPAVAGRHSQEWGVLRVFDRRYVATTHADLTPPSVEDEWDGTVLYTTDEQPAKRMKGVTGKALVVVTGALAEGLGDAAIEASALREALKAADDNNVDWVARRELIERASLATQRLKELVAQSWSPAEATWLLLNDGKTVMSMGGTSSALSEVSDRIFNATPRIANEMIAKRELTSQGAKARRELIEAMITSSNQESFAIDGFGPDRAMYEALFRAPGLHQGKANSWQLTEPKDRRWRLVWQEINQAFDEATESRLNLVAVGNRLKAAPIGLKDGVLPVILVAALLKRLDDIALYEHGSLVLNLDDAVAERLAKNPGHFAVKNAGASTGPRRVVVEAVAERLGIRPLTGTVTFLQVTRALYKEIRSLPPYTQQTKRSLSEGALGLRLAFRTATEPDYLLFTAVPESLGLSAFSVRGRLSTGAASEFAESLAAALLELRSTYPNLLGRIAEEIRGSTAIHGPLNELQARLGGQATNLLGQVIDPKLSSFVSALSRTQIEPEDWLANVAMVVAEGHSPRVWTDDIELRFGLQISDLGGMLRRTSALLFERRAEGGEAFDARRVTITSPDGSEQVHLVSLDDSHRAAINEEMKSTIERLSVSLGSVAAARQTLLAWLVLTEGRESSSALTSSLSESEGAL